MTKSVYAAALRKGLQRAENLATGRRERLSHSLRATLERFGEVVSGHYQVPFNVKQDEDGFVLYFGAWGHGRISWRVDVSPDLEIAFEDCTCGKLQTEDPEELEEFLAAVLEEPELHERLQRCSDFWKKYPQVHNVDTYYPLPAATSEQEEQKQEEEI